MDILPQILINGLLSGSVIALIAMGLSLIYGVLRFMNFAHGEIAMLGAFFYYLFFVNWGWPIFPSAVAAVVLCGLVGVLFNKTVFERLRNESEWTLLITSVGVSLLLRAVVLLIATGKSRNYAREGYETVSYNFFDGKILITDYQLFTVAATFTILIGLAIFLKHSRTGKAMRAVSDNMQVASILGIPVKKTITQIFILSTALAGFAGILIAYDQNLSPNMGLTLSIYAFAAVIVGGLGNVWGAALGAMILGVLQNLIIGVNWWGVSVPTSYKSAIAFSILILMLILRPRGLFGIRLEEEAGRK